MPQNPSREEVEEPMSASLLSAPHFLGQSVHARYEENAAGLSEAEEWSAEDGEKVLFEQNSTKNKLLFIHFLSVYRIDRKKASFIQ